MAEVEEAADAANAEPAHQQPLRGRQQASAEQRHDHGRAHQQEQPQGQVQRAPVPMGMEQGAEDGHQQDFQGALQQVAESEYVDHQGAGRHLPVLAFILAEIDDRLAMAAFAALATAGRLFGRRLFVAAGGDFGMAQAQAGGEGGEKAPAANALGAHIGHGDQCQGEEVVG
ncbi:hypothetical protein FQZ97_844370 [compost metagenome]